MSAKDGLGKTFGQPRRLAQERLRSEMTKCESAQAGVDKLIDRLEDYIHEAQLVSNCLQKDPNQAMSIKLRVTVVQILRCMMHYSNHLAGFKNDMEPLQRITYRED